MNDEIINNNIEETEGLEYRQETSPQEDGQSGMEVVAEEPVQITETEENPEEAEVSEDPADTDENADPIEAGEFSVARKEDDTEEIQQLHTKHPRPEIPVIDHRLLAGKLTAYNWLKNVPQTQNIPDIVEVQFKNTRKAFFSNPANLPLLEGDIVAVEAALGHDIGVVSLAGELVKDQVRVKRIDLERNPLKKVYRKAKPHDIEKWQQAIALEHETMIKSRKIAADLRLNMKIGDVEYQGDKTKAIFYYIADDRVDFRALIKVLAESFRIRIEMKQIGARQEAGRIGGIGPCGRKLCCSTFITNFISVSTSAARYQDISLNPQKLAGQCGKLKCCLNYEVDAYIDAQKDFPSGNVTLNTGDGMLYHQKTDIFGKMMSYTSDKEGKGMFIQIPVKRVKEIITMNRKGVIPPKAVEYTENVQEDIKYTDGVGEESLNRFDDKRQKKRHSGNRSNRNEGNSRNKGNSNNNRENGNNNQPHNEKREGNGESNNRRRENNGNNNRPNEENGNNRRPNNRNRNNNRNQRPEQRNGQQSVQKPDQRNARPEQGNDQKTE